MNILVYYSCHTCHLTKAGVEVPAREAEDVKTWLDATVVLLAQDHDRRSPGCVPADGKLHDVMIPVAGADKVGGPPVQ